MERRVYGVETEYGLSLETRGPEQPHVDPGNLFAHLERAVLASYLTLEVNSFGRNPAAGNDPIRLHEGLFLESGARLYLDTGHAEWATPEASSPRQAVCYELAGDLTLAELAAGAGSPRSSRLLVVKNNVDYMTGATYGSHENYQVERRPNRREDDRFFATLVAELVPFLVTRQIFCGGGKLGSSDPRNAIGYQISQRADYIDQITSTDSREARALVNTRDESLSRDARSRRLHLILGDANRSPHAALLKLGTTGLILRLIEERALDRVPELAAPLPALRTVSRDLTCTASLPLCGGGSLTAIEIQRHYLESAITRFGGEPATRQLLADWRNALDDLAADPLRLADRADWAIKLVHLYAPRLARAGSDWAQAGAWGHLFSRLQQTDGRMLSERKLTSAETSRHQFVIERHGLRWPDFGRQLRLHFEMRELDLRYSELRPEDSLFSLLEGAGLVRREFEPSEIAAAQRQPPAETRARARGEVVRWAHRHGLAAAVALDWGQVGLPLPVGTVALDDPLAPSSPALIDALAQLLRGGGGGAGDREGAVTVRVLAEEALPAQSAIESLGTLIKSWFGR